MKPEERAAYVEEAAKNRAGLQKKIAGLTAEREDFLQKERQKQAGAKGEKTLDEASAETTREQAGKLGYKFGK